MTNPRRRHLLRTAQLAWLAACQLAGCSEPATPSHSRGSGSLDERSPFSSLAQPMACAEPDRAAATVAWTKLRTIDYPYHLQTVALSPPFPSGCRALIIAEPPPTMSLSALQDLAPGLMASAELKDHEIGYDGWTRDVVVTLPPVGDAQLTELIAMLHTAMFDTTYRATALDTSLPVPAYDPAAGSLDVAIGPGELHRWLFEAPARFTPLGGSEPSSVQDLLASDEPEVYADDSDGLIAWVIPRSADIAELAGLFREFAVESDIIVGALASSTTVAILARERAIDPRIVQPLRFETASLLAAVHDRAALQQSYERTNPLACKIDEIRDWAPIFLSPELLDTEYGSVLDIADQFLKSWSNNGKTNYLNFEYPRPPAWAFPAPVFVVANASEFRYNWNTANVGAVVAVDDVDVFWLRRTGALNVSYFPDEDELAEHKPAKSAGVRQLEDTGYQFFAHSQTPLLVRVVQYNALFQIFAHFGLSSSTTVPAAQRDAATKTLVAAAHDALTTLRNATGNQLEQRVDRWLSQETAYLQKTATDDRRTVELVLPPTALPALRELQRLLAKLDANSIDKLSLWIADPRRVDPHSGLYEIYKQVRAVGPRFALFAPSEVYKAYAEHARGGADAWIHTPSVVISWNEAPMELAVGGHDLDAHVTGLRLDRDRPYVAASQIARGAPVDAVGARELPRLELGPSGPRLASAPVNRSARSALGGVRQKFWREPVTKVRPASKAKLNPEAPLEISVAKLGDGYRVVDHAGEHHELTNMPDMIEVIRRSRGIGRGELTLHFDGMDHEEVRRVMRMADLQNRAEVVGVVKPLPEFATHEIDFAEVRLRDTRTRMYPDGAGEIGHQVQIDGVKPVTLDVKVAVRRTSSGKLRSLAVKIRDRITSLIQRIRGQRTSPFKFARVMRNEVLPLVREELSTSLGRKITDDELRDLLRLELTLRQDAVDVHIVERIPRVSHGTRDLAG